MLSEGNSLPIGSLLFFLFYIPNAPSGASKITLRIRCLSHILFPVLPDKRFHLISPLSLSLWRHLEYYVPPTTTTHTPLFVEDLGNTQKAWWFKSSSWEMEIHKVWVWKAAGIICFSPPPSLNITTPFKWGEMNSSKPYVKCPRSMPSFWTCIHVLLDNLCVILIDLSTAALPHLNRLLADRPLNLLTQCYFSYMVAARPTDTRWSHYKHIWHGLCWGDGHTQGLLLWRAVRLPTPYPLPPPTHTHNSLRIDTKALVTTSASMLTRAEVCH